MTEPIVPLVSPEETERRNVAVTDIEWRTEGDAMHFTGYASVFDTRSVDLGGFTEEIKHGAFRKVLASGPEVRFLFNHDPNLVLANTASGTMELREDPTGLRVEADLAPTTWGKDLQVLIGRGDVNKMSFGFRVGSGNDSWTEQRDGTVLRQIKNFEALMDVGPVTYPAYKDTSAAMRSLSELRSMAEQVKSGDLKHADIDFADVARRVADIETESPWMAQQALRAFQAEEPEGRGVDPEPVQEDVRIVGGSLAAARQRDLELRLRRR